MSVRAWLAVVSLFVSAAGLAGDEVRPSVTASPVTRFPAPELANPTTLLWYTHPATTWDDALPVGNGRLGAMVFGKTDEEGSGSTRTPTGPVGRIPRPSRAAPRAARDSAADLRRRLHRCPPAFGRSLMGRPVEQQKYQSLAARTHAGRGRAVTMAEYRHELDLDTAIVSTTYHRSGAASRREVFVTPVDQVIVVRLTANEPGRISIPRAAARGSATRLIPTMRPTTSRWTATGGAVSSCAASRRTTSASRAGCATCRGSKAVPDGGDMASGRRRSSSGAPTRSPARRGGHQLRRASRT